MGVRQAGKTWRDEYELLCEGCGYSIEGLPGDGVCPECAKPIVESVPGSRVGSAWQQDPGLSSWAETIFALMRHPRRALRAVAIEPNHSGTFGNTNVVWAGFVLALTFTLSVAFGWVFRDQPVLGMFAFSGSYGLGVLIDLGLLYIVCWSAASGLFWLLTKVEYLGIRTFGHVHHTRITPAVALAITSHATAGWMVASVLASVGFLVGLVLLHITMRTSVGVLRGPMMLSPIWIPVILGFLGMLVFEMIVYTGVRECRFANRSRPQA